MSALILCCGLSLSCCRAKLPCRGPRTSLVVPWGLQSCMGCGLQALPRVAVWGLLSRNMWDLSSPTRGWTHVPCIGKQILNPWTTREVPLALLKSGHLYSCLIVWIPCIFWIPFILIPYEMYGWQIFSTFYRLFLHCFLFPLMCWSFLV